MAKTALYVPQRIKVGFNENRDTFSNRLAYITYFDEKNVLRKETSWENWRNHSIPAEEFDNVPTKGFAIDKNVGGVEHSWGRNARKTYIRVYDPRGFDFEITVPNLLYILNHCQSIPGEGLNGDFVYAWDGKELVLLPTAASEYAEIQQYTAKIQTSDFINPKDLKVGHVYTDKKHEELVYMGYFTYYDYNYKNTGVAKKKYHFISMDQYLRLKDAPDKCIPATYSDVKKKFMEDIGHVDEAEFQMFMKGYEGNSFFSPVDKSKTQSVPFMWEGFENLWNTMNYYCFTVHSMKDDAEYSIKRHASGLVEIENISAYSNNPYSFGKTAYVQNTNGTNKFTLREAFDYIQPYYNMEYLESGHFYQYDIYLSYRYSKQEMAKILKIIP